MILARRLAFATVVATLILIAVGVVVRATGSGLGCPDWPTCHGGVIPPGEKEPIIEMSHRFVATAVGLMVIALAVVCWRAFRGVPWIVLLAVAIVPLVGLQGLLGAVTVDRELPPEIVATHLVTAFVILSLLILLAAAIHSQVEGRPLVRAGAGRRSLAVASLAALAWLGLLAWVGGYLTESGASTACPDWPLCNGSVLPASDHHEVWHMAHRYIAALFAALVAWAAVVAWRMRDAGRWLAASVALLVVAYVLQVAVGALNVWYEFPNWLAVSHTVIASLAWSALSALACGAAVRPGRQVPIARPSRAGFAA